MLIELLTSLIIPLGLDLYMPVPEDNPLTLERIARGERLFFDARLSRDGSVSCATCHRPDRAFSDALTVSAGVGGRHGTRNAPSLVNRGYGRAYFWDARSTTLESQVLNPIESPDEMDFPAVEAAARVGLSRSELARALASFVRSILSGNSRFDRFANGERDALSADEQAGLGIFRGKGNCTACHVGPNFSDERVHNTGVAWRTGTPADPGAGLADFKTPTLRNIARTAPYMHDGSFATIEAVIDFYDAGGRSNPALDREIRPLHLTVIQKGQLAAFLRALTGDLYYGGRLHENNTSSPPGAHDSPVN